MARLFGVVPPVLGFKGNANESPPASSGVKPRTFLSLFSFWKGLVLF